MSGAHRSKQHDSACRRRVSAGVTESSSVVALPGPPRPELREALLTLYRDWVRTGRAELLRGGPAGSQVFAGSVLPNGQNVRSELETIEKTNTSVPATRPM